MSSKLIRRLLIDHWGKRQDNFDWRMNQRQLNLRAVGNVGLFHLDEKIGDALMISLLVDALAIARPELPIVVGTTESFAEYWSRHPAVAETIVLPPSQRKGRSTVRRILEGKREGKRYQGRFDVVVSFEAYPQPDHFALLNGFRAETVIGFNKLPFRLFDHSLDERRHGVIAQSIANRAASVMKLFDVDVEAKVLRAHVPYQAAEATAVDWIFDGLSRGPRLLLNSYGDGADRRLTPDSVRDLVREIRSNGHPGPIVVSVRKGDERAYEDAVRGPDLKVIGPLGSLFEMFALVDAVDLVISPDTAVGHVAAAFGKPQICLFARHGSLPIVWRPNSDRCVSLLSTSGEDVNDLDEEGFREALRRVGVGERSVQRIAG